MFGVVPELAFPRVSMVHACRTMGTIFLVETAVRGRGVMVLN